MASTIDVGIFGRYPVATWLVGAGPAIAFPIIDITETGGNRIVPHERPGREGAKLDSTGRKPRSWHFRALFNNSIDEDGVDSRRPLYPYVLRQLIRAFEQQETGTLTLPTVGAVRCRANDWTRTETPDLRDTATIECTFIEDNEDSLERAQLRPPSVAASLVRLAEQTQFSAAKDGVWSDDLGTLRERANEIVTLMKAPGRSVADVSAIVRAHRRSLQSIVETATEESAVFREPRASRTERQLQTMSDREAQAETERASSRPRTTAYVIDVERTSLYEVAALVRQDATELMDLNAARIDDPFDLTRGQVIRIYASAA